MGLAGAVGSLASVPFDPVKEEVHQFTSGQLVGLGVFLGVRYTDNVLIELALGLGIRHGIDVAEVGFVSGFGVPVSRFSDLLFAESWLPRHGSSRIESGNRKR